MYLEVKKKKSHYAEVIFFPDYNSSHLLRFLQSRLVVIVNKLKDHIYLHLLAKVPNVKGNRLKNRFSRNYNIRHPEDEEMNLAFPLAACSRNIFMRTQSFIGNGTQPF